MSTDRRMVFGRQGLEGVSPQALVTLKDVLGSRSPRTIDDGEIKRRAAVATILRARGAGLEVLLIRRADRENDPWSGHMGFPGGKHEPDDPSLEYTSIRETSEELGFSLPSFGQRIGQLDDVRATSRGGFTGLVVRPFVWFLDESPTFAPNNEVDEVHWASLEPLLRGEHDTSFPYVHQGASLQLPGFKLETSLGERIVWGLTHRMLSALFDELRPHLR